MYARKRKSVSMTGVEMSACKHQHRDLNNTGEPLTGTSRSCVNYSSQYLLPGPGCIDDNIRSVYIIKPATFLSARIVF